jgi:inosine/xanthosine triphosphate pyrophosphatase family protein
MVAYNCNLSTWEVEAGGLQVPGQPGLYSKTLSQKKKKKKEKKRKVLFLI